MVSDGDNACDPFGSMLMYSSPSSDAIWMLAVLALPSQASLTRNVTRTWSPDSETESTLPGSMIQLTRNSAAVAYQTEDFGSQRVMR